MHDAIKKYCIQVYTKTHADETSRLMKLAIASSKNSNISESKKKEIETIAQKEAIKTTIISGLTKFYDVEASQVWRAVYETHVNRKSGVDSSETIANVISADQSWKKSSGHAFEEMIKMLGTNALESYSIEIILQRDLNFLIKNGEIGNEPRDLSWLREQIRASVFDLYAVVTRSNKKFCYGVIQSKTSIRDRVTRDREPSIQAMESFFWSVAFTLDGDFLKNPKFRYMVNGGSNEHRNNGWHGMYVFSEKNTHERIYPTDLEMKNFKVHAVQAAEYWLTQRQWFNSAWIADEVART